MWVGTVAQALSELKFIVPLYTVQISPTTLARVNIIKEECNTLENKCSHKTIKYHQLEELTAWNDCLCDICISYIVLPSSHVAIRLDKLQSLLPLCYKNIAFLSNSYALKHQKFHVSLPRNVHRTSLCLKYTSG